MKAALKEHIKLSPLDTSKDLVLWCDAAPSEGMSYILAKFKDPKDETLGLNIIACDSTTFRKGRRGLSPFEAELACVQRRSGKKIIIAEEPGRSSSAQTPSLSKGSSVRTWKRLRVKGSKKW